MESIAEIPQCSRQTTDGRTYPARRKPVSVFNPTPREEKALQDPAVLEKLTAGEAKSVVDACRLSRRDAAVSKHEASVTAGACVDIHSTGERYRVVYADPPWPYRDARSGSTTGATDHYPTMPLPEICALPIERIAEDNAVLFLWVTSPMLEDAFPVINAWGFKYKASFVWDKVRHNMGHYNSVRHELLLICTRGSCVPDDSTLYDSVQSIERTEHSRKPEEFRAIIDALYPRGKRIELFARGAADGWDVWGYEA
jgi:N6-adenosine-specific RNA methylase IME4